MTPKNKTRELRLRPQPAAGTTPIGTPIAAAEDAKPEPVPMFPSAPVVEARGPGRPPKLCPICKLRESECKGHTAIVAPAFTTETVGFGLRFLSQMLATSVAIAADIPIPEALQLLGFNQGELAVLTPPATEVANKYMPDWARSNQVELSLLMVAGPMLVARFAIVKAILDRKKKEKLAAAPPATAPDKKPSPGSSAEVSKAEGQAMAA